MTTTFKFQLNRLIKDIDASLTKWSRPGRQPTLADMSQSVKSWEDDVTRLGNFTEALGPGYSQAFKSAQAAWHNRDQRAAVLGHVKNTVTALKSINNELVQAPTVNLYERRAAKTLFGDVAEMHAHNPHGFSDVYAMKRQLDGFATAQANTVSSTDVKRVKAQVLNFTQESSSREVYETGLRAVKSIDVALQYERSKQSGRAQAAWREASQYVAAIGSLIGGASAPQGFKSAHNANSAEDLLVAVEAIQDVFYNKPFNTPSELLPRAVAAAKTLVVKAREHYDPKTGRLALNVYKMLHSALQKSQMSSIKSMQLDAWNAQPVSYPAETALNQLAELESHLQSL
jgi:hypothetical protein